MRFSGLADDRRVTPEVDGRSTRRLVAAGLALTVPRVRILATLEASGRPASARELHLELSSSGVGAGLTTIHRVLHTLAEVGLLHVFPGVEQRYRSCTATPHGHLACRICDDVVEVPAAMIQLCAPSSLEFEVDADRSVVHGVCRNCRPL